MGTHITFKRPDGKETAGYLANAARGNAPGVVVIQEWWGLSENNQGHVRPLCGGRLRCAGARSLQGQGGALSRHGRCRQSR